jgi:hypothetical protein
MWLFIPWKHWGDGGTAPFSLKIGIRRKWVLVWGPRR